MTADTDRSATAPAGLKALVQRLVDEAMNGEDLAVVDELCTQRLAPKLRRAYEQFRAAFPDWHQEVVELVEEGNTVVARLRCTGTQLADWDGLPATGRTMHVDEVQIFHFADGHIAHVWALEDTWARRRQLTGEDTTAGALGALG